MNDPLAEARRIAALRKPALAAADFPRATCPASRHVHETAVALVVGCLPPALEDDDELAHLGANMLATVAALWEARAELRATTSAGTGAPHAVAAALDRLTVAVEALAAERDDLRRRVVRALAELDVAPAADPDRAGKLVLRDVARASVRAAAVLRDGGADPAGEGCSRSTRPGEGGEP